MHENQYKEIQKQNINELIQNIDSKSYDEIKQIFERIVIDASKNYFPDINCEYNNFKAKKDYIDIDKIYIKESIKKDLDISITVDKAFEYINCLDHSNKIDNLYILNKYITSFDVAKMYTPNNFGELYIPKSDGNHRNLFLKCLNIKYAEARVQYSLDNIFEYKIWSHFEKKDIEIDNSKKMLSYLSDQNIIEIGSCNNSIATFSSRCNIAEWILPAPDCDYNNMKQSMRNRFDKLNELFGPLPDYIIENL